MDPRTRNIFALGVLGLVLVVVGFWFLLLSPLLEETSQTQEERAAREARLQSLDSQVSELESVRDNSAEIERRLLELSRRVPEQDETPALLVQLQEISNASGVVQLSIDPGDPELFNANGVDYSRIPIEMTFEGTYEQLQDFLFRLRNLSRLVTVNELQYAPVPAEAEQYAPAPATERLLRVELQSEVYIEPSGSVEETTSAPDPPDESATDSVEGEGTVIEGETRIEEDGTTTVQEETTIAP